MWPHTAVSKKYIKRTSFVLLDYKGFIAGESKVIYFMLARGDANGIGRLRVMTLIAHWFTKTRNWQAIKSLYESILEEVEMGEREWLDDFSGYETMLPTMGSGVQSENQFKVNKKIEVYWCKQFQSNACDQGSPHMAQIKLDEPAVPVLHICVYCWSNFRKWKEHAEIDCMAKK